MMIETMCGFRILENLTRINIAFKTNDLVSLLKQTI